jgi:FkbM family methyltransferase
MVSARISREITRKIKVNGRRISYYGYQMQFPKNTGQGILSNIYWNKEAGFEQYTGRLLIHFFERSNIFIDVGANFGFYSVLAARCNPTIQVFAFEPLKYNFVMLEKFVAANKIVDVNLFRISCSNYNGSAKLFFPDRSSPQEVTTASFDKNFFYNQRFSQSLEEKVECIRLDDALNPAEKSKVVIKIDVEGHEMEVLEGAESTIIKNRPVVICEVLDNKQNVSVFFKSKHYETFGISSEGLIRMSDDDFIMNHSFRDYLFLPGEFISLNRNFIAFDQLEDFKND